MRFFIGFDLFFEIAFSFAMHFGFGFVFTKFGGYFYLIYFKMKKNEAGAQRLDK